MDIETSYVIKSFVALGILYTYYLVALRNKRFHSYNRWYLLVSVVLSLVIPFINFSFYQIEPIGNIKVIKILEVINSFPIKKNTHNYFTPTLIIYICVCSISLFLLVLLFLKIIWIYRVKQAGNITKLHGFNLIETNVKQAPFSFLNNLFWKHGMSFIDTIGKNIFKHELTHIRQHHSYDKLFTQIVACICWMNPFYWIIQKELDAIHEFIADAASIEEGDAESFALMLLQVHNEGRYLSPSHSFFNSSIKRRLIMITSSKKASFAYTRRVMALPIAVLLVTLFSIHLKAQTDAKINEAVVKSGNHALSDTARKVDHIEIYGETGKGDTATVYLKNGAKEVYILKNVSENNIFKEKYGQLLSHPPTQVKEPSQAKPKADARSFQYEPLNPIPESISNITFSPKTIWLTLKDGTKEKYDLNNRGEKENFESKYGALKIKKDI